MFIVCCVQSFIPQHVYRKEAERDGVESTDSTSSPRATSPSSRSKSPDSEPVSPPTSPLERSTSPPRREASPVDRSISPKKRSVSPFERSMSPEDRPVSHKERPVSPSPTEELSGGTDVLEESSVTKRSATYSEVEDSLAALDAIADSIGQDDGGIEQEEKTEVNFYLCSFGVSLS